MNESKVDKSSRDEAPFGMILEHLKKVYSGRIAYEFMHIPDASERRWFYHAVESWERPAMTPEEKKRIFELLSKSEVGLGRGGMLWRWFGIAMGMSLHPVYSHISYSSLCQLTLITLSTIHDC